MRRGWIVVVVVALIVAVFSSLRAPVFAQVGPSPSPACGTPLWTPSPGAGVNSAPMASEIQHVETCAALYWAVTGGSGAPSGANAFLFGFPNSSPLPTVQVAYFNGNLWPVFNVISFGATGNGTTDDSGAIQSAVAAACAANGGVVYLPPNIYKVNATVFDSCNNVYFLGGGHEAHHDTGTATFPGTVIRVGFAGPGIEIAPSPGPSPARGLIGVGMSNLGFDSNFGNAGIGLEVLSSKNGIFSNLFLDARFTTYSSYWGSVSQLGESTDTQGLLLQDLNCSTTGTYNDTGGSCFYFDGGGTPTGDFSLNTLSNIQCQTLASTCMTFNNADNDSIRDARCFQAPLSTATCVDLKAQARALVFLHLGGHIVGTGVNAETGSSQNQILYLDSSNQFPTPQPTISAFLNYNYTSTQEISGTCSSVATTGTTCTFPNGFQFRLTSYVCYGQPQATSSPVAVSWGSATPTTVNAYSEVGTITTLGYTCKLSS